MHKKYKKENCYGWFVELVKEVKNEKKSRIKIWLVYVLRIEERNNGRMHIGRELKAEGREKEVAG